MNRTDAALAALVALLWGFNFVVIDWGMGEVPPLLFLAARFVAVLLPAVFLVAPPQVAWRTVAAVGVFMSLGQFSFLYLAMDAGLPPGLAGLVLQAQVVFTIVIAAVALGERAARAQVVGVGCGVVGLVVVALGRGGQVSVLALGLCLLGALMWGIGNVISRAAGVRAGLSLTVWSALVVPVPLVCLSLVIEGPDALSAGVAAFGWKAAVSTLYTAGFASLVGYGIFNGLLARNPSAAVVPWILLVPPIAMGSSWALMGDVPAVGEVVGGGLLVLGVLAASRARSGAALRDVPTPCNEDPDPRARPAPSGLGAR